MPGPMVLKLMFYPTETPFTSGYLFLEAYMYFNLHCSFEKWKYMCKFVNPLFVMYLIYV
jgi:hypothetical protein